MLLEGLYTALSGERSPGFNTILKVTKARGSSWMFKLHAWWAFEQSLVQTGG
jgi:DNA-binding phage protein